MDASLKTLSQHQSAATLLGGLQPQNRPPPATSPPADPNALMNLEQGSVLVLIVPLALCQHGRLQIIHQGDEFRILV